MNYCVSNGRDPFVIYAGSKIMMMSIGVGRNKITLIDSLNFLTMPLKAFPKTFDLQEMKKGYFPHFFNKKIHDNYIGPMPAKKHYGYDQMSVTDRNTFIKWYNDNQESVFDMKRDILDYCISDVHILKAGFEKFRDIFIENEGADPSNYVTIASTCMNVYRGKYMPSSSIAIVKEVHAPDTHSKVSIEWLNWMAANNHVSIQHAINGREHKINYFKFKENDGDKKVFDKLEYMLDGYDAKNNTAYEFHGCYWHGCPTCYNPKTMNTQTKTTMGELYRNTLRRSDHIKNLGYNLVEIWQCQWTSQLKASAEIREFVEMNQADVLPTLNPRDAMYGGRVEASKLHWKASVRKSGHSGPNQIGARYADITSLYPTVNYYDEYPVGHHTVINKPSIDAVKNKEYFGLIQCKILPPSKLYHPVLPVKMNGKLLFPLCHRCAITENKCKCAHTIDEKALVGSWTSVEVYKALEMGYKLLDVYEVWHWKEKSTDLFKTYVSSYLKIKQESSGYPVWCKTDQDKKKYIDEYALFQGVRLDPSKIQKNEGKRAFSKLCLNSLWGKFGQDPRKSQTVFVKDQEHLYKLMTDDKIDELDINIINANCIEATYMTKQDHLPDGNNTNINIAIFTTSHARMRLYKMLDKLGEQVLYCDTDSIIYMPGKNKIELGDYLGDWTDELGGAYIMLFVSGGPKNYGYILDTGKTVCKIKGFTLNYENCQILNIPNMLSIINKGLDITRANPLISKLSDDDKQIAKRVERYGTATVVNEHKITIDKKNKQMLSKYLEKQYSYTYNKRIVQIGDSTIDSRPYGYVGRVQPQPTICA
jgi:G:T-mismatch repair DNA endonuclease (very short patch repair protein)